MRASSLLPTLAAALVLSAPGVLPWTPAANRAAAQAPDGLKIFVSADMEGVVGAVTGEQLGPGGFEYERFREFMTAEVNAIIDAAMAEGATEIVVADAHGNGQNLLIERLPRDVRVVRSWPRPLMMMEGIDSSFDAAIFQGYHASTTNPRGVRAHTMSSANLTAVRLNGVPVTEGAINAAIAGHFDVPVILVTGDDAAVEEVQRVVGNGMEGAAVKEAVSFHAAETLTPEAAYDLIGERTRAAIRRLEEIEPYRLDTPILLEVSFKNYRAAEILSYLPNVSRVDAHTVGFTGRDMVEVSRFIEFMLTYRADLSP